MGKKRVMVETIGFLSRLRRDVRGNTLAFMAALLVPLAALSGSAIDVARMYAVKTRLQQACDAGALAGRKSMTSAGDLDTSATGPAQSFFKNNFQNGWFSCERESGHDHDRAAFGSKNTPENTHEASITDLSKGKPNGRHPFCGRLVVADAKSRGVNAGGNDRCSGRVMAESASKIVSDD